MNQKLRKIAPEHNFYRLENTTNWINRTYETLMEGSKTKDEIKCVKSRERIKEVIGLPCGST